ncbi:MAG: hypothetical protein WCA59_05660 [Candidatus Binataceae bacterium]
MSWAIFSIFMAANALIIRQWPQADPWLNGSIGCLLGLVVALFVWHPLQRRVLGYLYFFEDVVCPLEKELKKAPLSEHFLLTGELNPRYREHVKGPNARKVMLFTIDGTAGVWAIALIYYASPSWCSLSFARTVFAVIGVLGLICAVRFVLCDGAFISRASD